VNSNGAPIIAAVGLRFEARIATGPGVLPVCCAAGPRAEAALTAAVARGCSGIISFGICGGLDPALSPGDGIVASSVLHDNNLWPTHEAWSQLLLRMIPNACLAPILGVDDPVTESHGKRALRQVLGAAAVDTESHVAAAVAARNGLPFAAYRVVADGAGHGLPRAALAGRRADGGINPLGVVQAVLADPSELAALIRLASHTRTARESLMRARRLLGPAFGLQNSL
jgi:hopanoid-associated phosphorylase